MRLLIVLFVVAMLSACIGNTVQTQNATPVQQSLWRTENYRVPSENTGVLIIKRDTGMRGAACIPMISLNGDHIAPLNVGEKLELHIAAGRHSLRAYPNRNCAASAASAVETFVEIKQSQTTNYRFGFEKRSMVFIPAAF
jgi:hypothetical protein